MKYIVIFFFLATFLLPKEVVFANSISGSSAALIKTNDQTQAEGEDPRVEKMKVFLKRYNSPLARYSRLIVKASDNYDLPWTLVASIAGIESTFCKKMVRGSYNCWGWKNGSHNFRSFEDAIFTVSKTLRYKYFNRGRTTPELIAPIYAPPSSTWSRKVRFFMNNFERLELGDYNSLQITI